MCSDRSDITFYNICLILEIKYLRLTSGSKNISNEYRFIFKFRSKISHLTGKKYIKISFYVVQYIQRPW